jgi:hypothetical protein
MSVILMTVMVGWPLRPRSLDVENSLDDAFSEGSKHSINTKFIELIRVINAHNTQVPSSHARYYFVAPLLLRDRFLYPRIDAFLAFYPTAPVGIRVFSTVLCTIPADDA